TSTSGTKAVSTGGSAKPRTLPPIAWAATGALAVAVLWLLFPSSNTVDEIAGVPKHIVQSLPAVGGATAIDISRGGEKVAMVGDAVQVLDLRTGDLRRYEILGTVVHVDFADNGEELLLTKSAGIDRMSLSTGSVVNVVNTREGGPRAEWRDRDFVVYEEMQSIFGMSLTTLETRKIVTLDSLSGEYDMDFPYVLPDGNTLIATAEYRDAPSRIGFWDIDSGRNLGYLDYPGYRVQWLKEGFLVFSMEGRAMALPFDLKKLKQTGPIVSVEPFVRPQGLSVSNEGTLVSVATQFQVLGSTTPISPVVYRQVGSSGELVSRPGRFPAALYANGAVSPDGKSAAVAVREFDAASNAWSSNIWILDFTNGSRRALTQDGRSDYPAWSPAGDSIYFIRDGVNDEVVVMAASGRGGTRTVSTSPIPTQWDLAVSPDGEWAATAAWWITNVTGVLDEDGSRLRLWNLRTGASFTIDTPNGNPRQLDFSPSGRYLAFEDREAVFVLPLEDIESTPYPVWENSMSLPRWGADESKLYGRHETRFFVSIDVRTSPDFATAGPTVEIFPQGDRTLLADLFDVFPNTEHFEFLTGTSDPDGAAATPDTVDSSVELRFIINVPAQLEK
ncbi:MAG: hypothetical protein R3282_04245, partial [Rhodothermales bacterium]|nr:hypothetical protein [Rhodothermales bacterium]